MKFEIHTVGTPSAATLLETCDSYESARAAYDATPTEGEGAAWAIVPTGRPDEMATLEGLLSINPRYSDGCYVQAAGDGCTCLGFANALAKFVAVREWLQLGVPYEMAPGSLSTWLAYKGAMRLGAEHNRTTRKVCPADLTPQLIGLEGKRVEVLDSHGERRRFRIGKSMGWMPCHLELAEGADGGGFVTGAPFEQVRVLSD